MADPQPLGTIVSTAGLLGHRGILRVANSDTEFSFLDPASSLDQASIIGVRHLIGKIWVLFPEGAAHYLGY